MGLFTAISVPQETAEALQRLRSGLHGARWVEPDSYHITLSYMGEVGPDGIEQLIETLDGIRFSPFTIRLQGLGVFGAKRPRAVWAGLEDCPELISLQARQARAITGAGFRLERRKYTPHVTLARFRKDQPNDLQRFVERRNVYAAPEFVCETFSLMSSRPNQGGGPYGLEARFSGQAGFLPDMSEEAF